MTETERRLYGLECDELLGIDQCHTQDAYVTDDAYGYGWHAMLGDSCERLAEIPANSVDLTVSSPPFASLFTYSPSDRDLGNNVSRTDFLQHYGYVIRDTLRVTKPGRLACIHVQQLTTTKTTHGYMGLTDFRGQIIEAHIDNGWHFHGEVTVNKDPQAQAIRTKAHALMFTQKNKDSIVSRPALADYLLIFRKPGDNEIPVTQTDGHPSRVDNETWIDWAQPVWWNIRETDTLNTAVAKEDADERHICPLQLGFIARCIRLWSNPGELVLDPFGGIGSTGVVAIRHGRRSISCELKPSYWRTAVRNLQDAERGASRPTIFDVDGAA